jgi:uncharacterized protein YxjI
LNKSGYCHINQDSVLMGNSYSEITNAAFVELTSSTAIQIFGEQHCHHHRTTMVMKERTSFSGDGFTALAEDGSLLFKIDARVGLRDKKMLKDGSGNEVAQILHSQFTMHGRQFLLDKNQKVRVIVLQSSSFAGQLAEAWILRNPLDPSCVDKSLTSSRPSDIRMFGNWTNNFIFIKGRDQVIGKIQRTGMNGRNLGFGKDAYALHVPPHVDSVLMVLLVACLDDIFFVSD